MNIANEIAADISIELGLKRDQEVKTKNIITKNIRKALQTRNDEKAAIFNNFYQKTSNRDDAWDSMQELCHLALGMDINLKLRE